MVAFQSLLSERTRVVALTHVSNVLGAVYPVREATALAKRFGAQVLVDGAQSLPHLPIDVQAIGCDYFTASGHKMGGPSSVGFLWGRAECLETLPFADGGSTMAQTVTFETTTPKPIPQKFEAGEPAFGEVIGFEAALEYWMDLGMDRIARYERDLTAYAVARLREIPGVRVLGDPTDRISVVSFVVEGQDSKAVEKALDAQGIAARAGQLSAQPLLNSLGLESAVRASFVFYNTRAEADALATALRTIAA